MKTETIGPNHEIVVHMLEHFFCAVFDGDIDGPMIGAYSALQAGFAREQAGRKIVTFSVVRGGSPAISEDIRTASAEFIEAAKAHTEASAVVFDTPGMLGVIIRSVITGILLLARPAYPFRTFATADAATRWLSETSPSANEKRAALDALVRATAR